MSEMFARFSRRSSGRKFSARIQSIVETLAIRRNGFLAAELQTRREPVLQYSQISAIPWISTICGVAK
jgi:hypothetical protein